MSHEPDVYRLESAYGAINTRPEHAIQELEVLAGIGSSMAPLYLGWIYQTGDSVIKDDAKAEYWFKLSADRGQKLAAYYLGHHYLKLGRNADAIRVFERDAAAGSIASKYCLAMAILGGESGKPEFDKARKLLTESAAEGHVFAMRALASMYLSGKLGMLGRLYGLGLWGKAVITGLYLAVKVPDDERLRA